MEFHFSQQAESTLLINTLNYKEELLKNANGNLIGHKRFSYQTKALLPHLRCTGSYRGSAEDFVSK